MHHGDEHGVAADRRPGLGLMRASVRIDADAGHPPAATLEPRAGLLRGGVLDDGRHDVAGGLACLREPANGQVVRLGAAGREQELVVVAAEQRGDLATGASDGLTRMGPICVTARGVSKVHPQKRQHGALGRDAFIAAVAEVPPKPAEMEAILQFNRGRAGLP